MRCSSYIQAVVLRMVGRDSFCLWSLLASKDDRKKPGRLFLLAARVSMTKRAGANITNMFSCAHREMCHFFEQSKIFSLGEAGWTLLAIIYLTT